MEIKMLNAQEILREYDSLIGITMYNIYVLSKDIGKIRLLDFDYKNPDHLYFLRVALIARDIYDLPIEVKMSWWTNLCLNWKLRKGFNRVPRADKNSTEGIHVQKVLEFMRPVGKEKLGENFNFANIYHQYYEGSLS